MSASPRVSRLRAARLMTDVILVLECVDHHQWQALHALAQAHVTGRLTYEGWRCATSAIVQAAAERAATES